VQAAFAESDLGELEFLAGIPEYKVALPGGNTASQTDLFVLARTQQSEPVVIAVEGKAREPFGDSVVADWRADGSPDRETRLRFLLQVLELADDDALGAYRYQLLHRTASPLIEARRLNASHAVMLVHSFGGHNMWFDEYRQFASAIGADVGIDRIARATRPKDSLFVGWVSDSHPGEPE
jgi:hypothetical protein